MSDKELNALTPHARLQEMAKAVDYSQETVVVFRIKPPIDEPRWKVLVDAARVAGAVHAHVNPPDADACEHGARCIEIVQRLAEVYTVDTDQVALIRLVNEAKELMK